MEAQAEIRWWPIHSGGLLADTYAMTLFSSAS